MVSIVIERRELSGVMSRRVFWSIAFSMAVFLLVVAIGRHFGYPQDRYAPSFET